MLAIQQLRCRTPGAVVAGSILLLLTACGGGSGADVEESTPVTPQTETPDDDGTNPTTLCTGDSNPAQQDSVEDACGPGAETVAVLVPGTILSGTVAQDDIVPYRVPAGGQVILNSLSGDADIFLVPGLDSTADDALCAAVTPFKENICSADTTEDHYAVVYGDTAADYQIEVSFDCSVSAQNNWVDRSMRDYYLFYDQVPVVDPDAYPDPESLLRDLRVDTRESFSSLGNAATRSQFLSAGTAFGMGYTIRRDEQGRPRLARVYREAPMGRAGLKRSDIIESVNGVAWDDLSTAQYNEFVGTREEPLATEWVVIDGASDERKTIVLTQAEYQINSAIHQQSLVHPEYSGSFGYLVFERFIGTSAAELDSAMDFFREREVSDLIVDLRYNGGGLTRIARKLASQIAGPATDNLPFGEDRFNDKYSSSNFAPDFPVEARNLGLNRVVVITTGATASASEMLINALRPYIEVITIGDTTLGKPFVSTAASFCGRSLSAMHSEFYNVGDVSAAGGITADCYAADDLTRDFGFHRDDGSFEGMARAAADYLVFGTCESAPALAKQISSHNGPLDIEADPAIGAEQ